MKNKKDKEVSENTETSSPKKTKRIFKLIGNILFFSFVGFMVVFSLWNGIDRITGYKFPFFGTRTSVIVSESMQYANEVNTYLTDDMHRINKFDVITTKKVKNYDEIKLYDVITYVKDNDLICHRVIEKYSDNNIDYLVLRGDTNSTSDTPISFELVRGKVINVTPKAGKVVMFFQSGYLYIALFGTMFFIFLGMFIFSLEKKKVQEPTKEITGVKEIEKNVVENNDSKESKNEKID